MTDIAKRKWHRTY